MTTAWRTTKKFKSCTDVTTKFYSYLEIISRKRLPVDNKYIYQIGVLELETVSNNNQILGIIPRQNALISIPFIVKFRPVERIYNTNLNLHTAVYRGLRRRLDGFFWLAARSRSRRRTARNAVRRPWAQGFYLRRDFDMSYGFSALSTTVSKTLNGLYAKHSLESQGRILASEIHWLSPWVTQMLLKNPFKNVDIGLMNSQILTKQLIKNNQWFNYSCVKISIGVFLQAKLTT